ncbi:large repetitive protein [Methylomarinovum tepidoasis]|uniref:Large repetitive protein n=1 Tax=Methylomarinovum tepidoasis TaxID=2840183 RepID=A0AAU9CT28_9GAMM|nr:peptidase M10A and M12B matrixin and adamalysin [Methylomarinovum sp. IN45]BCX87760.1 large repetitive protein [Methylomarinovum sp. IN45]
MRRQLLTVTLTLALTRPAAAFDIAFDYTYGDSFFDASIQNILDSAAAVYESRITDTLADTSGLSASIANPSDPNQQVTVQASPADTLTIYLGARDLGSGTLGLGGPVWFEGDNLPRTVSDSEFEPAFGTITFNNAFNNWYIDPDPSTTESFSGYDFYSVALHEIGHVMGIGSAPSWDAQIQNGTFTGPAATAANNGAAPNVTSDGGHWAEGTQSTVNGQPQEAAMDPTIGNGQRKQLTDLDWAALDDIGWDVQSNSVSPNS